MKPITRDELDVLWNKHTAVDIAGYLGTSVKAVHELIEDYGLRLPGDPTESEILEQAEAIRNSWSEAEKNRRAASSPVRWRMPEFRVADLSARPGRRIA